MALSPAVLVRVPLLWQVPGEVPRGELWGCAGFGGLVLGGEAFSLLK